MSNPIKKWADKLVSALDDEERYNDLCDQMEAELTQEECDTIYDQVYAVKGGHHA